MILDTSYLLVPGDMRFVRRHFATYSNHYLFEHLCQIWGNSLKAFKRIVNTTEGKPESMKPPYLVGRLKKNKKKQTSWQKEALPRLHYESNTQRNWVSGKDCGIQTWKDPRLCRVYPDICLMGSLLNKILTVLRHINSSLSLRVNWNNDLRFLL